MTDEESYKRDLRELQREINEVKLNSNRLIKAANEKNL